MQATMTGGMPKGNSVVAERVSKEYRDRYANFSKGAHFTFGGQGKNWLDQYAKNEFLIHNR